MWQIFYRFCVKIIFCWKPRDQCISIYFDYSIERQIIIVKKNYEKPLVAIEHYMLTQSIASCNINIDFLDSRCVLEDPDSTNQMRNLAMMNYFTSGACSFSVNNGDNGDGICYHTNVNAAFNS